MTRSLRLIAVSALLAPVLAGCSAATVLPPIDSPSPLTTADQVVEARLDVSAPFLPPEVVRGFAGEMRILTDSASGRAQTRLDLSHDERGDVLRVVHDVVERDGELASFRQVEVTEGARRDLSGAIEDGALVVRDASGAVRTEIEWTPEHRLGGPRAADLRALGLDQEGGEVTLLVYRPLVDVQRCVSIRYRVGAPRETAAVSGIPPAPGRLVQEIPLPIDRAVGTVSELVVDEQGEVLQYVANVDSEALGGGTIRLIFTRLPPPALR